jgi:potassium-transporting ATPase KdpC subunit
MNIVPIVMRRFARPVGITAGEVAGNGRAGKQVLGLSDAMVSLPGEGINEADVEDGLNIGRQLGIGLGMVLLWSVITGVIYPLVVTGVAQVAFPAQANGSIAYDSKGQPVGSLLIEQVFTDTAYFYGRPSAGGTFSGNGFSWASDTDPGVSSGSNLGPTNAKLVMTNTVAAADNVRKMEGLPDGASVPVDLATASGSGLDPHITPAAATLQVPRVAKARGMSEADVQKLVDQNTDGRDLGFLGEPRVNVLKLNLALDAAQGAR